MRTARNTGGLASSWSKKIKTGTSKVKTKRRSGADRFVDMQGDS